MLEHLENILETLDQPVEWVGLRYLREQTTLHRVRDRIPEFNGSWVDQGCMVEVLADGQIGYAATSDLSRDGILTAVRKAEEMARLSARWPLFKFGRDARPPARGSYTSPPAIKELPLEGERVRLLQQACELLKINSNIIRTEAILRLVDTDMIYLSSSGAHITQTFHFVSADFVATAEKDGVIQRRSDGGLLAKSYQGGWEVVEPENIRERCRRIGEEAYELVNAPECPTEVMDLVLAPDQMMLQIHESIGHALELDRILGDERNYAGWSFVKLEDFGKLEYGSPLLNITFNPTIPAEFASYGYDDGGLPAEKVYLIRNGILERPLGGKESQLRTGLPGTANFRASSWNRPPIDRMANLNLEPGTDSAEALIGSVERGIFMTSNRSWSIDDFRRKFQFGCEYGRMIENGELTHVVRNPNYRGITIDFWHKLFRIGGPETFQFYGTPYCGKGEPNQSIRVGHGAPLCLFRGVQVFGGA